MRTSRITLILVACLMVLRPSAVPAQAYRGGPDPALAAWLEEMNVRPDSVAVLDSETRDDREGLLLRVGPEGGAYWIVTRSESRPDRIRRLGVLPATWSDPSIEALVEGDVYVRKLNGYGAAMLHAYLTAGDGTILEDEFGPPRPGPVAVFGDSVYAAWTHGRAQLALAASPADGAAAAYYFRIEEPIESIRRRGDSIAFVTNRRAVVRHSDGGWGGYRLHDVPYRPPSLRLLHAALPQFRVVPGGLAELRLRDTLFIPLDYPDVDDFRRARPGHLRMLPDDEILIDVDIGPVTDDGERIWFGLSFYDGEGLDGVGGIGWLDPVTREAALVYPPAMADYSVSAIAVLGGKLLLGLAVYGEGAIQGAGLARYDPATGRFERILESAYLSAIVARDDRIFATSDQGLLEVGPEGNVLRWQVFPPPRSGSSPPVVFSRGLGDR